MRGICNSWEEICFREEIGEQQLWMKKRSFIITVVYSTRKKLCNEGGSGGYFYITQAQVASL